VGGSGGGNFRYMFGRFLAEACEVTGDRRLGDSADEFRGVADTWQRFAEWCRQASETDDPAAQLGEAGAQLTTLASLEEAAWRHLAL